VQAYNAILQAMANTSPVANTMIYFTSANTAAVTTITAYGRQVLEATSGSGGLGLGTMANQNANAVAITGGTISGLANALPVTDGGTGGINPFQARTNLGLGTMATQNANAVAITGGSISGLTTMIPIDSGGTGANTCSRCPSKSWTGHPGNTKLRCCGHHRNPHSAHCCCQCVKYPNCHHSFCAKYYSHWSDYDVVR
jgi:hypothetical protein